MHRMPFAALALLAACAGQSPAPARIARDLDLEAYEVAVRWPSPSPRAVMTLASMYSSSGRPEDGYAYFAERSAAVPGDALFLALTGMFQAKMSAQIALLDRAGWVQDAIARLDRAVEMDANLPRFIRGLVLAQLPAGFGKTDQAIADLQWVIAHFEPYAPGATRAALIALAHAYENAGRSDEAADARARSGAQHGSAYEPLLFTDFSVDPQSGFRFGRPSVETIADGVWVARGYDFADIAFVESGEGLIAIDAGTTPETTAAALQAIRDRSSSPVRSLILTHAHWDHAGGISALAPAEIVASQRFAQELAGIDGVNPGYSYFFGPSVTGAPSVAPTRTIAERTEIAIGGRRLVLIPIEGGETTDGLMIDMPDEGILFVGDAFMPYLGAPFANEGSPDALLQTIDAIRALGPRRLIHGHVPLTRFYTGEILDALQAALRELQASTLEGLRGGESVTELLGRNVMPELLATSPDAVLPYLTMREQFVRRLHRIHTGYWQPHGEDVNVVEPEAWAGAIDLLAGNDPDRFVAVLDELDRRGDHVLEWRLAEAAVLAHPDRADLEARRVRALDHLRERTCQNNPFRFIIYSELSQTPTAPVAP